MSIKSILKNLWLLLCKPFEALKEEYESKLAHSYPIYPIHFTQKEYREFCKISQKNEKFDKGEI